MMHTSKKYNVVLLMADQFRGDCLGCAGNNYIETPYFDELASEGFLFTSAYSAVPSCIPARSIMMTGMNQWHTGVLGMGPGIGKMPSNYCHTLPGEFADNGYHTQGIGKMHFSPQRALNGFHHTIIDESGRVEETGFVSDYRAWFEKNKTGGYGYRDHSVGWNSWMSRPSHLPEWLHSTGWTADQAIDFLGRRDPEKPFFLKVSFNRPHSPYDPPQVYYDMYKDAELPEPVIGDWAEMNLDSEEIQRTDAWRGKRSDKEIHRAKACYYGSITFVDHQVGKLIYEMKKAGVYDNTIILFVSDHGDMLGDHYLWRKTYAYEGSSKIPWIMKLPKDSGIHAGQKIDEVVELMDVMPTLLDAAGLPIPDCCDGKSVMPLIKGEDVQWREYIHGEHCLCYHRDQENHFITDGKHKYIWLNNIDCHQFFDLTNDPGELHNLINDPSYTELIKKFNGWLVQELDKREYGLVQDHQLVRKTTDENLTSPNYRTYNCK
ncbi:MAG: arylsulfatase [Angelakisella sp.]